MEYLLPTTWTYILACFLLIPAMSWLDRQRGTPKDFEKIPKLPALLGMGYLSAFYTGHMIDWQAMVITLSIAVSHNIGFGHPIGFALTGKNTALDPNMSEGGKYEPWQVTKLLKENPWVALALRGFFVGFWSLVALDWVASLKIALAFGIAFPLAPYIVRFKLGMGGEGWAKMEELRGMLIGIVFAVMATATFLVGA